MIPHRTMIAAGWTPYQELILADAPYAYYRFEQAPSETVGDKTPAGRHATWQGEVQLTQPGLVRGSAAAARLGGKTTFLDLPFGLDPVSSTVTFELWIQTPATLPGEGIQTLLAQRDGAGTGRSWLYIDDTDRDGLGAHSLNTTLGGAAQATGEVVAAATRYHLVLEVTPEGWQLHSNGQARQQRQVNPESATGPFVLGLDKSLRGNAFQGLIDEVAFYTHTLGSARILAHWQAGQ